MSIWDNSADIFLGDFGIDVEYDDLVNDPVTIKGIFDTDVEVVIDNMLMIKPRIKVASADVPDPDKGHTFTIGSKVYAVLKPEPDKYGTKDIYLTDGE